MYSSTYYLFLLLQIASVPKIEFTGLCDSLHIYSVIASLPGDAYLEPLPILSVDL